MKIAYLILVHENPALLRRLIAALSCQGCGFFLHVDRRADIREFAGISADSVFLSEERLTVYRAGFSMVEATLVLLREALRRSEDFDYFVLLSGAHYPLRSGKYIQRFFEENRGWEFINIAPFPDDSRGLPHSKIDRLYYEEFDPVRRVLSRALAKVGLAQRDHRRFLGPFEPYGGSQWWALTRDACAYIINFVQSDHSLSRFFRNTCCPDEMFFHSILGNSPFRSRTRRNLTYLHWPAGQDRPSVLDSTHVQQIESSYPLWIEDEWGSGEALFARKFSGERPDLLDRVDAMIKRREEQGQAMGQSCAGSSGSN